MITFERECTQVRAAVQRHADRIADDEPNRSEQGRFAASAFGLAIVAVIALADERGTSTEQVLDELIETSHMRRERGA